MNPINTIRNIIEWLCPLAKGPEPDIDIDITKPTVAPPNTPEKHDGWHNQHFGD